MREGTGVGGARGTGIEGHIHVRHIWRGSEFCSFVGKVRVYGVKWSLDTLSDRPIRYLEMLEQPAFLVDVQQTIYGTCNPLSLGTSVSGDVIPPSRIHSVKESMGGS